MSICSSEKSGIACMGFSSVANTGSGQASMQAFLWEGRRISVAEPSSVFSAARNGAGTDTRPLASSRF
jgi:hypothetical protein